MKVRLYFGLATLVAFACINCTSFASEKQDRTALPLTKISDFYQNSISYTGKRVRVRGYLFKDLGSLWFLRNSFEDGYAPQTPFILVKRSAYSTLSDGMVVDPTMDCADNYVELIGVSGQLPHGTRVGVTEIESITVFESGKFLGAGTLCFDAVMASSEGGR